MIKKTEKKEVENRCKNCFCLIDKNGWFCDEIQKYCIDIKNCPEEVDYDR